MVGAAEGLGALAGEEAPLTEGEATLAPLTTFFRSITWKVWTMAKTTKMPITMAMMVLFFILFFLRIVCL